jgi:hypothetical protein
MPKNLALLTIHGMGDTPPTYHVEIQERLKERLEKNAWSKLIFKPLYYQKILQGSQERVFEATRKQIDWMKLRKFLLYGFSDAASLEHKKELPGSCYEQTQAMILNALDAVFDEAGMKPIPVVILAQSLGCQVMSSYIWDAQQKPNAWAGVWSRPRKDGVADGSPRDLFRRLKYLECFYTTGCNIPIFVAGHKKIEAFDPPAKSFKWYNFFDEDDVLGWPLKPLGPSYAKLVEDISVNAAGGVLGAIAASWNPVSHGQYWADNEVLNHLVSRLEQLATGI